MWPRSYMRGGAPVDEMTGGVAPIGSGGCGPGRRGKREARGGRGNPGLPGRGGGGCSQSRSGKGCGRTPQSHTHRDGMGRWVWVGWRGGRRLLGTGAMKVYAPRPTRTTTPPPEERMSPADRTSTVHGRTHGVGRPRGAPPLVLRPPTHAQPGPAPPPRPDPQGAS